MHQIVRALIKMKAFKQNNLSNLHSGFALIEVLVSVLVLGIGLLGLAGLHAASFRDNQGASFRSQAVYAVNDLADRMRANRTAAIAGDYLNAANPAGSACLGPAACTSTQMANADLVTWNNFITVTLPNGTANIACLPVACGDDAVHIITVNWTGNQSVNNQLIGVQTVTTSFTP